MGRSRILKHFRAQRDNAMCSVTALILLVYPSRVQLAEPDSEDTQKDAQEKLAHRALVARHPQRSILNRALLWKSTRCRRSDGWLQTAFTTARRLRGTHRRRESTRCAGIE